MKTILLETLPFLLAEAGNILPIMICVIALCGLQAKTCLILTVLAHVALMIL